jgi:hypothetical protein
LSKIFSILFWQIIPNSKILNLPSKITKKPNKLRRRRKKMTPKLKVNRVLFDILYKDFT